MAPATAPAVVIDLGDDRVIVRPIDDRERAAALADLGLQRTMTGLLGVFAVIVGACTVWYPSPAFVLLLLGLLIAIGLGLRRIITGHRELRDGQILELRSDRRSLSVFASTGRRVLDADAVTSDE